MNHSYLWNLWNRNQNAAILEETPESKDCLTIVWMEFNNTQTFEYCQVLESMTLMLLEMKENGGFIMHWPLNGTNLGVNDFNMIFEVKRNGGIA